MDVFAIETERHKPAGDAVNIYIVRSGGFEYFEQMWMAEIVAGNSFEAFEIWHDGAGEVGNFDMLEMVFFEIFFHVADILVLVSDAHGGERDGRNVALEIGHFGARFSFVNIKQNEFAAGF